MKELYSAILEALVEIILFSLLGGILLIVSAAIALGLPLRKLWQGANRGRTLFSLLFVAILTAIVALGLQGLADRPKKAIHLALNPSSVIVSNSTPTRFDPMKLSIPTVTPRPTSTSTVTSIPTAAPSSTPTSTSTLTFTVTPTTATPTMPPTHTPTPTPRCFEEGSGPFYFEMPSHGQVFVSGPTFPDIAIRIRIKAFAMNLYSLYEIRYYPGNDSPEHIDHWLKYGDAKSISSGILYESFRPPSTGHFWLTLRLLGAQNTPDEMSRDCAIRITIR